MMKILGNLPSLESLKLGFNESTKWFGRTAVPIVTVGSILAISYLANRYISSSDLQASNESFESRIARYQVKVGIPHSMTNKTASEFIKYFDQIDDKIKESLFSPYDESKDRPYVFQLIETMVPIHINGKKIDYNGALFKNPINSQEYVLMQAPLPSTMTDTQVMLQQNKVKQIVCLTTTKCDPYWEDWITSSVVGVRGLYMRVPSPQSDWGNVKLWHYTEWPDQGVPENLDEFIKFVKLQRNENNGETIAVHCSFGLGRTGVFMVATLMIDLIESGMTTLNPLELIALLRKVRPGSVQTAQQLHFCFELANRLLAAHLAH